MNIEGENKIKKKNERNMTLTYINIYNFCTVYILQIHSSSLLVSAMRSKWTRGNWKRILLNLSSFILFLLFDIQTHTYTHAHTHTRARLFLRIKIKAFLIIIFSSSFFSIINIHLSCVAYFFFFFRFAITSFLFRCFFLFFAIFFSSSI